MKDKIKQKRGKKSRAQGAAFELRVRKDLEEKGWIIDKWSNNVEFEEILEKDDEVIKRFDATRVCGPIHAINENEDFTAIYDSDTCMEEVIRKNKKIGKLVQAKPKFLFINGGMRMVGNSSGFPDFIGFKPFEVGPIIGVESKMNGDLDRVEKDKCRWLLDEGIFDKILIAEKTKVKNRVVIVYHDFTEKYYRFLE